MTEMPTIYAPVECGHCFAGLEFDEGWTCSPCQLHWPDANPYAEVEPVFLDEDAEPCAEDGGRDEREHSGYRFWNEPCNLPTGHTSSHHYPMECERLAAEPDDVGAHALTLCRDCGHARSLHFNAARCRADRGDCICERFDHATEPDVSEETDHA